jgi:23S rRNA pseudouridine1911/1915/1917 synthase
VPDHRASTPDLAFAAEGGETLAAALRRRLPDRSWSQIRKLCESGKAQVAGGRELDPARRLEAGALVELRMNARAPQPETPGFRLVHEDAHLVVIEKPEGVSSVPYERKESGTAMDLVRAAWRRQGRRATVTPLYVVHRLDKDTSGLLCFAKTKLGERGLHAIFKGHLADREYLAVAHGEVKAARIESVLIPDRGDRIRGSVRPPAVLPPGAGRRREPGGPARRPAHEQGQWAATNVEPVERLRGATLCRVRLETGRTHQIRIHLAEIGHPLVGETVYIRDLLRADRTPLPSSRLLLHAATLGFDHPVTKERLQFSAALPPEFMSELERLKAP